MPDFLLAVLQEGAGEVAKPLEALVTAEILQPKRYGAEIRYEFRHALLQRMAYESMVQSERRAMHRRIVEVLRSRTTLPTIPEVMAHHLTEAGNFPEAIGAWLQAGVSAARRSANVEAVDHLRRGLGLLDRISAPAERRQLELNLQVSLMSSILATQSATSIELSVCCERGLALCDEGEATPLVFPFLFGEFTFTNCRGETEEAERLARLFLSLAERNANDSGRVIGHRMLGMVLFAQGHALEAREQIDRSLALYRHERDAATTHMFGQNTEVHSKSLLSLIRFCLGDIDAALDVGLDALRAADAIRHPHSTAIPLCYVGGWVFGLCDATDNLMRESRRLIALSEQHRLAGFRAHGTGFFGWALCQRGDLAQGIAAIEQAIAAFDSIEFRLSIAGHLANLADAQRRTGRLGEAEASSARAMQLIPQSGRWLEPEIRRVDALVVAALAPQAPEDAEARLRGAIACARTLGFPIMERRCLASLQRFLATAQRDAEVDARLNELAHFGNLDRRVEKAVRTARRSSPEQPRADAHSR
jgi:tetratricopeptide (TPR) repeat protein